MEAKLIHGEVDNIEYVDFINYVFGMNGVDRSFYKLLPKLYGKHHDPASHTWFVCENGRPLAAVGAYPLEFLSGNKTLRATGIGNVAVHPNARSKGYMIDCMNAAIDDAVRNGDDLMVLSGRRQRYGYFGFDRCCNAYKFYIDSTNIRHVLGSDYEPKLGILRVCEGDEHILDQIADLHTRRRFYARRDRTDLYDIMSSWNGEVYAFTDGDDVAGWAILDGHGVIEFATERYGDIPDMLALIARTKGGVDYNIPPFEREIADVLVKFCEHYSFGADIGFSVLRWARVLDFYMSLGEGYVDGVLTVEIEGVRPDSPRQKIRIEVKDGKPAVEEMEGSDGAAQYTLTHLEAMQAFFGIYSPIRETFPAVCRTWFPAPILIYETDNV